MQPLDRDLAVIVVERGEHAAQRHDRVGERSTERAAVLRDRQHVDADGHMRGAADAGADRRHAGPVVPPIRDHGHVAPQQVALPADELRQMLGRAFLFALDDDLDRTGERTVGADRPERRGVDHDPGFVVGGSSTEEPAVGERGCERGCRPGIRIGRRLHVMVRVQQDRGPIGRPGDAPEDGRVPALDLQEFGADPRLAQDVARQLRARADVGGVVAVVSDRGDRDQSGELIDHPRHVLVDAAPELVGVHGGAGYRVPSRERGAPPATPSSRRHRARTGSGRGAGTGDPARTRRRRESGGIHPNAEAAGSAHP